MRHYQNSWRQNQFPKEWKQVHLDRRKEEQNLKKGCSLNQKTSIK